MSAEKIVIPTKNYYKLLINWNKPLFHSGLEYILGLGFCPWKFPLLYKHHSGPADKKPRFSSSSFEGGRGGRGGAAGGRAGAVASASSARMGRTKVVI